jgi:hypothetical protein
MFGCLMLPSPGSRRRAGDEGMTLELNKIMTQVDALAQEAEANVKQASRQLGEAREWLHKYADQFEELKARAREFSVAMPTDEPLNAIHPAPAMPERFTVIGADGSTIAPDHHSATMYYLINAASLTYQHGSGEQPVAVSFPTLGYKSQDLYEGLKLVAGNLLDVRRDTAELKRLADAAEAESHDLAALPLIALTDGTLLLWVLEDLPQDQRRKKVEDYVLHLSRLKAAGAAAGGFISRPRYSDVLRLVWMAYLGKDASRDVIEKQTRGLADRSLFDFLAPGERSAVFISPSPVNLGYGEHRIGFFYLNVGGENQTEIARVEAPGWVCGDPDLLNRLHGAVMAQCRLVTPYPYVLARAHELAVITTDERRQLESFVETALLRHGLQGQPSQKAFLKGLTGGAKRVFRK